MKWPIKRKEHMVGKKRRKKRNSKQTKNKTKQKTLLSEKKEEAGNVSEQRVKGWIHVICVHDITHLSRQQHGRAKDAH